MKEETDQQLIIPHNSDLFETIKEIKNNTKNLNYPKELKMIAIMLRNRGLSLRVIQKSMGIPFNTIHYWTTDPILLAELELEDLSGMLERGRAQQFGMASNVFVVNALRQEKLDKASTKDLMVAANIATQNKRLIMGESTENIDMLNRKVVQMDVKRAEIDQEINDIQQKIDSLETEVE